MSWLFEIAEMFTLQRYLQLTALQELKVDHFDAWAGEAVAVLRKGRRGQTYHGQD